MALLGEAFGDLYLSSLWSSIFVLVPFGPLREPGKHWLPGEPKWLPRRPPLTTEVWIPPKSHFGSSSVISVTNMFTEDFLDTLHSNTMNRITGITFSYIYSILNLNPIDT